MNELHGCGEYSRILEDATHAVRGCDARNLFRLALYHRQTCPECRRMNTPLEEQLFNRKVKVSEGIIK